MGDYVYIPGIKAGIAEGKEEFQAKVVTRDGVQDITLLCKGLTGNEKQILQEGCLMNFYAAGYGK